MRRRRVWLIFVWSAGQWCWFRTPGRPLHWSRSDARDTNARVDLCWCHFSFQTRKFFHQSICTCSWSRVNGYLRYCRLKTKLSFDPFIVWTLSVRLWTAENMLVLGKIVRWNYSMPTLRYRGFLLELKSAAIVDEWQIKILLVKPLTRHQCPYS